MNLQPAIKVKNLSRSYKEKNAVKDVSFEVKQGEIYAFLGPNGAGKSTTIKMLVTLIEPTDGYAEIYGLNIQNKSEQVRLLIGVALQEASLDEAQTGLEFLKLQGRLYGLSSSVIESRIKELLTLVDIGDAIGNQIKTYSGGMKRRLDLAASIIHKPKVLFLDEPTTGLDPISRAKVWSEVQRLNKELGMTIFLTTQYLEEADKLADRVGIINDGIIAAEGTPQELKNSIGEDMIIVTADSINKDVISKIESIPGVIKLDIDGRDYKIITNFGANLVGKIATELNNAGINIDSLTLRTTTLDDVFFHVTGNTITN